jgi:hypothetical protein
MLFTHRRFGLPSALLILGLPPLHFSSIVLQALSAYPLRLHYSNYIWRRVQVMKLPVTQRPSFTKLLSRIPFFASRREDRSFCLNYQSPVPSELPRGSNSHSVPSSPNIRTVPHFQRVYRSPCRTSPATRHQEHATVTHFTAYVMPTTSKT